jgi:hypothetical protein
MKFCFRLIVLAAAFLLLPCLSRAQEALEIRADQNGPEPTPIPEKTAKPEAPAESPSEEETPKKRTKEQSASSLQDSMTSDEFKKAGLDKLSPDELNALNQWMKGYRHQAETKAAEKATEQTKEQAKQEATTEAKQKFNRNWLSTDRIFSRIDGEFHGMRRGGKKIIIRLEDGTVWKQVNNDTDQLEAKMTDHPPVMVTHSAVGYKMHVIGTGEFYVNPVREKN